MKKLILAVLAVGLLYGCGTIVPSTERIDQNVAADMGGAGYDYHRIETVSPDGAKQVETRIRSTSQRDITKGSVAVDGSDGSFTADVEKTEGNAAAAELSGRAIDAVTGTIGKALDKIPGQ